MRSELCAVRKKLGKDFIVSFDVITKRIMKMATVGSTMYVTL